MYSVDGVGNGIADSILDLIGATPLVRFRKIVPPNSAEVLGKMESRNPGGSVKDRIASAMITAAEDEGIIQPGDTIVEATSGNTGVGLALVAAVKGYKLIVTMPESMTEERRRLVSRFGADLVLTPAAEGMSGAVNAAEELGKLPRHFLPRQFDNVANPAVHRSTTAQEILAATDGRLDCFVAGVGTGGTITGVGEVLKEHNPEIKIVAVEPKESPVLQGGEKGPHGIQGIGAGFVPSVLNRDIYDEIIDVSVDEAYEMTIRITKEEGILTGISGAANVLASIRIAEQLGEGKRVVTVVCDTGERYLSVNLEQ